MYITRKEERGTYSPFQTNTEIKIEIEVYRNIRITRYKGNMMLFRFFPPIPGFSTFFLENHLNYPTFMNLPNNPLLTY